MSDDNTTHFGFRKVSVSEKASHVKAVFDSVASRYDIMNDLMSLGIHRLWKRQAVALSGVRRGQRVLDLAAGTGDLAERFSGIVGPEGEVVMSDINAAMLGQGRARLTDLGLVGTIRSLLQAVSAPFWGFAADRFSRKRVIIVGTGLWGLWTLFCGLTQNFGQLLVIHHDDLEPLRRVMAVRNGPDGIPDQRSLIVGGNNHGKGK